MLGRFSLAFALGISLCGLLGAQVTTGTFYGIVSDPSGAVVPGAAVTLINEGTGVRTAQTADTYGEFAFQFLPIGSYTVRIEAAGFKAFDGKGFKISSGQTVRQTFTLEVGQISERVTVSAETMLVNTVSVEQRQGITTQSVRELPIARRNIVYFGALNTGAVATVSGGNNSGTFNFNGLGEGTASITVDGTDASADSRAPQAMMFGGFNSISAVSLEAVEEVQTAKGVISAEYARTLSGNLNLITRSGTNEWHGSLFENWQGRKLNARNAFLASKVPFTFNQFGGSLGGPVIRNRVFIFGVYEGVRDSAFTRRQGVVPTERLRRDLASRWPAFQPALDAFPLPTQPHSATAATAIFEGVGARRAGDDHIVVKPDVWLSQSHRVSMTYTRSRPDQTSPNVSPVNSRVFRGETDRVTGTYTLFRPRWSAETRFGYNRSLVDRRDLYFDIPGPGAKETVPGGRRLPTIIALGFDTGNSELFITGAPNTSFEQKVATQKGRHSIKAGGIVFLRRIGGMNIESPQIRFENESDLLNNIPSRIRTTFGKNDHQAGAREFGFFLQDDWRATQKLVLNLGLRYDYSGPFTANGAGGGPPHVYIPGGILDSSFRLGPFRPVDNPYDADALNLGPRVGLAYNPDGQGKNVIRAAMGVMFTSMLGETVSQSIMNGPDEPFRTELSKRDAETLGLRYPTYNEDVLPLVKGRLAAPAYQVINPEIDSPYSLNYFLSYQRALTSSLALESAFVANRGVKFQMRRQYNQPDRVTGIRPNPAVAADRYIDNSESTHYLSWQSSLRKRLSHRLTGNIHYTWGKVISYGTGDIISNPADVQSFFDVRENRGPSNGDVAHTFVSDFVYELPRFTAGSPVVRHTLGGWQTTGVLTASTGRPLSISQPTAYESSRPDATGLDPIRSNWRDTLQYLNPAAFALVPVNRASGAAVRPGTLGRNAVRGPGTVNLDFSLGKNFSFAENVKLQFRADMFNATNTPNLGGVVTRIDRVNFGRLTSASSRQIQLNARLTF